MKDETPRKKVKKTKTINLTDDGNDFRKKSKTRSRSSSSKKSSSDDEDSIVFIKRSSLKNYVEIPFDELINDELPTELNKFNLSKKRTYCNKMDLIIEYDNKIFNEYPLTSELLFSYLSIKWMIDKKAYKDPNVEIELVGEKYEYMDSHEINTEKKKIAKEMEKIAYKEFFDNLYNTIFVKSFINFITEYVEEHYTLNIDAENAKTNKKYNPVLQFNDKQCKILQSISIGMKVIIPLISHYAYMYNVNNMNSYLQESFDYLFDIFSVGIDMHSKLWESVYSRLITTKNSDKIFWVKTSTHFIQ